MIKVYLDWNVMAQMKDGQWHELKEIMLDNTRFWKPYSTSHISDIFSSFNGTEEQNKLIEKDLNFISELTGNSFIYNDGKNIVLDFEHPQEYFQQRVNERNFFENFSLDSLFKVDDDSSLLQNIVQPFLTMLKQIPIDEVFKDAFSNSETVKQINLLLPDLGDNPTMEDFFNSFGKIYKNLNDGEDYKDLRKMVQSGLGINKNKIYDSKDPYKIIEESYKKLFGHELQANSVENNKNAPLWFNQIANEYLKLDMHGYHEDKVEVSAKRRKQTFKNTTEDAFHCAFASTCHFYIINDKRSYPKAKQVFRKLQLNTFVCKPGEFLEYYKNYLDVKEGRSNIELVFSIMKDADFYEEKLERDISRTYTFSYFIFDFFNKIQLFFPYDESPILFLNSDKPTNGSLYIFEIRNLVKKLKQLFGNDLDNIGEIEDVEFDNENWIGRRWLYQGMLFSLDRVNNSIRLYLDFIENQKII